jgi:hypothetical protein
MHNFRCRLTLKHVRFVLPTTRRHPILPRDYRDAGMCKRLHPTICPHIVPDPVGANEYMCTGGNTNFNTCIALIIEFFVWMLGSATSYTNLAASSSTLF